MQYVVKFGLSGRDSNSWIVLPSAVTCVDEMCKSSAKPMSNAAESSTAGWLGSMKQGAGVFAVGEEGDETCGLVGHDDDDASAVAVAVAALLFFSPLFTLVSSSCDIVLSRR
jgi:hypothetical protein